MDKASKKYYFQQDGDTPLKANSYGKCKNDWKITFQ